jgi:hypothetical protein
MKRWLRKANPKKIAKADAMGIIPAMFIVLPQRRPGQRPVIMHMSKLRKHPK